MSRKLFEESLAKKFETDKTRISNPSIFKNDSAPQIGATKETRQRFLAASRSHSNLVELYGKKGLPLYVMKKNKSIYFYAEAKDDLQYFAQLTTLLFDVESGIEHEHLMPTFSLYHCCVYRSLDLIVCGGYDLAPTTFWRIQKPMGAIMVDMMLDQDNLIFWQRRLSEAIENRIRVLAVCFSVTTDTHIHVIEIIPIVDGKDFRPCFAEPPRKDSDGVYQWCCMIV
jgi:hypothetical protein